MNKKYLAVALFTTMATASSAHAGGIQFSNAPIPTSDLDKRSILTSQFAVLNGEKLPVKYNTIMRSGDQPGSSKRPFGTLIDSNGDNIRAEDNSLRVSNDNDFSSLIEGKQGGLFMVSHFESRPAAMYLTELQQNRENGKLTAVKTRPLDFSHVKGGWVHCAGSVTPWGNHLGSEEYPPDGKQWRDKRVTGYNASMARYFGVEPKPAELADDVIADNQDAITGSLNPYDYGYVIEVTVRDFQNADVVKHYSMGRVAFELAYVMPNRKTVYISDDGSHVGLFRYEADVAGDLSSGVLYAAKWDQTSTLYAEDERVADELRDGGAGKISWIELGHATDAGIRRTIDDGVTFADIFDEDVDGCTTIINRDTDVFGECLKVKPGMEKAAAFLETSRYAGIRGATLEFEKMEGITLDQGTNTLYLAMSRVREAMTDGEGDIRVPYNYCGAVYALDLNEDFVATRMQGVVNGIPRTYELGAPLDEVNPYPDQGAYAVNQCDLNSISEPDNISFIPAYKTLIIGEDTGKHQNDMVWAYNVDSRELSRIQTTPFGSETTSVYAYPNIGGHSYVMSVVQHPFGESDEDALKVGRESRGYTGYLGPFPALKSGQELKE